jgi:trigger factor
MLDLKIQVEELSPILRRVSVEVPPTSVDEALAEAYRDLSRTAKVKGFRPGKVPRHVLERFYRADVEREVVATLVQSSYRQAVDEKDLFPVAEPVVENESLALGKPFRYLAQVEVKPKLDPKDYLGLPLTEKSSEVGEVELDAELEKIEARKIGVAGDWALIDYDLQIDGKQVESLERNRDQPVELTDGEIIKGHLPELRGVEVGQAIDLDYTFPPEYRVAELRGKVGHFHVTLKGLRRRDVPALDDELVKDLDEPGLTTLPQLRERIRTRMSEERKAESDRDLRQQIAKALVERNAFEAPPALVNRMAEGELRALAQQIVRSGIDPETLSIDQSKLRAGAELRIKAELLLEAVAEKEKLAVTDADLEAHFERVAAESEQPLSKVKAQLGRTDQREALNYRVQQDKALAFLRSKATITPSPAGSPGPAVGGAELDAQGATK